MSPYIKFFLLGLLLAGVLSGCQRAHTPTAEPAGRLCAIDPDYANITIPPNIAPLNFRILEKGRDYIVRVAGEKSGSIILHNKKGDIRFPIKRWQELLRQNTGSALVYDIYVKQENGGWLHFDTFTNTVAAQEIDSYLVYRLIHPAFKYWNKMGIYQRNLENFDQKPIIVNKMTDGNCMNCHNFCANDPSRMLFHIRAGQSSGTYISTDGNWRKVNLKTEFNKGGAYPSWHPSGKMIVFSVNTLKMFYHSIGESRDVLDTESNLVVYDVEKNMISASPQIADPKRLETFPAWSADGRYLYFCATQPVDEFVDPQSQDLLYDKIRYDLMRAAYNIETDEWGALEKVVAAEESGLSAVLPRPSPDGKYVLFTMAKYGSFPIYHNHGDLYLLDVASGAFRRLEINSEETDSFHSWSSNSRWFVFTSKRRDGLLGRPFFSYMDENGRVHKPFVLPQKNPNFYAGFVVNYNVPELVNGPITVNTHALVKLANDKEKLIPAKLDPLLAPRLAPQDNHDDEDIDALYQARPQGS